MPEKRSNKYGSIIMEAMKNNVPVPVNGNVPNRGLISNLPQGCCVEVPCLVDANGVQPTLMGELAAQKQWLPQFRIND